MISFVPTLTVSHRSTPSHCNATKECGSKHHLSWNCPDNTKVDKKKLNVNKAAGADETSQARESSSSPVEPRAGGGEGATASSDRGGEAAAVSGGSAAGGERESKPKQRKPKKAPAQHVGGDDLEDDDYYDPEDVPGAPVEADAGAEDHFGSLAGHSTAKGRGGAAGGAVARKKKSKVVVF